MRKNKDYSFNFIFALIFIGFLLGFAVFNIIETADNLNNLHSQQEKLMKEFLNDRCEVFLQLYYDKVITKEMYKNIDKSFKCGQNWR